MYHEAGGERRKKEKIGRNAIFDMSFERIVVFEWSKIQ